MLICEGLLREGALENGEYKVPLIPPATVLPRICAVDSSHSHINSCLRHIAADIAISAMAHRASGRKAKAGVPLRSQVAPLITAIATAPV